MNNAFFLVDTHGHFYPSYEPCVFLETLFQRFLQYSENVKTSINIPNYSCQRSPILQKETSHVRRDHGQSEHKERLTTQDVCTTSSKYIDHITKFVFVVFILDIYRGGALKTTQFSPSIFASIEGVEGINLSHGTFSLSWTKYPQHTIFFMKGIQYVPCEGFEILGLGVSNEKAPLSARDIPTFIESQGGVVVYPWSFGKWTGTRRGLLSSCLITSSEESTLRGSKVFLGDISLRRASLPLSGLVTNSVGLTSSIDTHYGSDPLLWKEEVRNIGRLVSGFQGFFDPQSPHQSILVAVSQARCIIPYGVRHSPLGVMITLLRTLGNKYILRNT
jgi:hypothetical protein